MITPNYLTNEKLVGRMSWNSVAGWRRPYHDRSRKLPEEYFTVRLYAWHSLEVHALRNP